MPVGSKPNHTLYRKGTSRLSTLSKYSVVQPQRQLGMNGCSRLDRTTLHTDDAFEVIELTKVLGAKTKGRCQFVHSDRVIQATIRNEFACTLSP